MRWSNSSLPFGCPTYYHTCKINAYRTGTSRGTRRRAQTAANNRKPIARSLHQHVFITLYKQAPRDAAIHGKAARKPHGGATASDWRQPNEGFCRGGKGGRCSMVCPMLASLSEVGNEPDLVDKLDASKRSLQQSRISVHMAKKACLCLHADAELSRTVGCSKSHYDSRQLALFPQFQAFEPHGTFFFLLRAFPYLRLACHQKAFGKPKFLLQEQTVKA